jgi:hypothetical protein
MKTFLSRDIITQYLADAVCPNKECQDPNCNAEYVLLKDAEAECRTQWEIGNNLRGEVSILRTQIERLRGFGRAVSSRPADIISAVVRYITELTQKLTEANAERQRLDKINADLNGQLSISKSAQDFWFKRAKQAEETLSFAAQVAPPRPIEINLNPFDRPAHQQQMYGFEGMAFRYDPKSKTVQVPVDIMRQTVTKAQAYRSGMVDYNEALSRDNNALRESLLAIAKLVGAAEGSKFADVVLVAQDIVADRNVARTELRAAHRAIDSKDEQIEDLRDECNINVARQMRVDRENTDLRTTLRQMNRYAETRINTIARLRNTLGSIEKRVNDWYALPIENSVLKEVCNTCTFADDVRKLCKDAEDPKPTTGEAAAANGNSR